MSDIKLVETTENDLNSFFQFQLNEEGRYLAAFISSDTDDEKAYIERWRKILSNPEISIRTIKAGNEIAGSVPNI